MKCVIRFTILLVLFIFVVVVVCVMVPFLVERPAPATFRRPHPDAPHFHKRVFHSHRNFKKPSIPKNVEDLFIVDESEHFEEYDVMLGPPTPSPPPIPDIAVSEYTIPMVSDRRSTAHEWPWPETKSVLQSCSEKYGSRKLRETRVSVVVCFHEDEDIERLLHTVHSVWQRSPHSILHQIIIIDDGSVKDVFKSILTNYMKRVFSPKIILLRNERREGLIRCRLRGVRAASEADIVVSLDSHVEVQPRWLEPLVDEITQDPRTLASSSLDWMSKQGSTWLYKHGGAAWKTVFDWRLMFSFQAISPSDAKSRRATDPIRSPVMVGTAWAMDVSYLAEVGALDGAMEVWGGENIDLAVRVWLMGGRVVNVPCSWVAHFESPTSRSYRSTIQPLILHNYRRFVDVWMGDYARYVYAALPELQGADVGDLRARLSLKQKAVHDFGWFRLNVFPELGCPDIDSFAWGVLRNRETNKCLTYHPSAVPILTACDSAHSNQRDVYWSRSGELRLPLHSFKSHHHELFDHATIKQTEATSTIHQDTSLQWLHWRNGPVIEVESGLCLTSFRMSETVSVMLGVCRPRTAAQTWTFAQYTASYNHMDTLRKYQPMHQALELAQDEWNT